MVKRTITDVTDALNLTWDERETLRLSTLDFLHRKYNKDKAKIAKLNPEQLKEHATDFLTRYGSRLFCQNGVDQLKWPRDSDQLVDHITELMNVQSETKKRHMKERKLQMPKRNPERNSDDPETSGEDDDDNDEDYEYHETGRESVLFKLPNTREKSRKNLTRQAAIVPTVEPSQTTTQSRQRSANKRASFDKVIIPQRQSADSGREASASQVGDTVCVQESPLSSIFDNDFSTSMVLNNSALFQSYDHEQSVLPFHQQTPPASQGFGSDDLGKSHILTNNQDAKPCMPSPTTPVVDITNDIEIYLHHDHVRGVGKEQVNKVLQAVLYWLVDRSHLSEHGRRKIRQAEPSKRAMCEHEARFVSRLLDELWSDNRVWNGDH